MLKVTDRQFAVLAAAREQRLLDEAVAWLATHPAAARLGPDGQRALAADALAFWKTHGFVENAGYRGLVALRLAPGFTDPLPPLAAHLLTRPGFAEATRVAQARDALAAPRRRLVRLDEDLAAEHAA